MRDEQSMAGGILYIDSLSCALFIIVGFTNTSARQMVQYSLITLDNEYSKENEKRYVIDNDEGLKIKYSEEGKVHLDFFTQF